MPFEVRQKSLAKFEPEVQNSSAPARAKVQSGSKHSASKTEGPRRKKKTTSTTLSHQVADLSNAVQGIQVPLVLSFPSATHKLNVEMRGSISTSSLPRIKPAAECSREELDTLSLAVSDSLITHE